MSAHGLEEEDGRTAAAACCVVGLKGEVLSAEEGSKV